MPPTDSFAKISQSQQAINIGVHVSWSCSHETGKPIFLRAIAKFFCQQPTAKNEKINICRIFKGRTGIHSVQRDEVPKNPGF